MATCALCGGGGFFSERIHGNCANCNGSGKIQGVACPACAGIGMRDTSKFHRCSSCSGTGLSPVGQLQVEETLTESTVMSASELATVRPSRSDEDLDKDTGAKPKSEEMPSSWTDFIPQILRLSFAAAVCLLTVYQARKYNFTDSDLVWWGIGGFFVGFILPPLLRDILRLTFSLVVLALAIVALFFVYRLLVN